MRVDHDGKSLWFGATDAPAPEGAVAEDSSVSATIAIQPPDASNRVEVLYRINGGTLQTLPASWFRTDPAQKVQYFRAQFPPLRLGDRVDTRRSAVVSAGRSRLRPKLPSSPHHFASANCLQRVPRKDHHRFLSRFLCALEGCRRGRSWATPVPGMRRDPPSTRPARPERRPRSPPSASTGLCQES